MHREPYHPFSSAHSRYTNTHERGIISSSCWPRGRSFAKPIRDGSTRALFVRQRHQNDVRPSAVGTPQ
jgi:hypothetical protein